MIELEEELRTAEEYRDGCRAGYRRRVRQIASAKARGLDKSDPGKFASIRKDTARAQRALANAERKCQDLEEELDEI